MKKLIVLATVFITMSLFSIPLAALENNKIDNYQTFLKQFNDEYGTDFHIIEEDEYYQESLDTLWQQSYDEYLNMILNKDFDTIKQECLDIINIQTTTDVKLDSEIDYRSTKATKTVIFNSKRNKMTLTYKYTTKNSAKVFDTSYKPTAKVTRIMDNLFFIMNSYTGSFKNSNKTYSVVAKGSIYTPYGMSDRTFTVNFNL